MGAVASTNIVTDGLVGCWDAANKRSYPGTGTTWTDLAGDVNGTLVNEGDDALSFNSFKGGYFELDGTDGRVDCGDNLIVGWSELSVCVWVLNENSGDQYQKLVTRAHDGCFDFVVAPDSVSNYLFCYVNSSYINTPTGSLNAHYGKWTHYAMRWKTGTNNFRLYINGELEVTGGVDSTVGINDTGKYNLSFADRPAGDRALNGNMGSVYIYNRALSDDEIKQNYEALKPRFEPRITKSGMLANWDAGDPKSYNGGQTWTDTANGFVGPFYNGAGEAISFDSANGGSLVFDGTDDRIGPITLPGDYSGTARSILLWVSPDTHEQEMIAFNSADDKFKATVGQSTSYGTYIFRADVGGYSPQVGSFADSLITEGDWACIGMTINASDEIVSMYLNGVSKTGGGNGWNFQDDTYIGRSSSGAPWNGKIATVRLYTKTLSAAEVMDNYQKTKARFGH